ncbi:alpha/beta fold hydrolase [Occultella gossypii]|uniref:Alpha/beta hydrolase n=1 Tax=Occultella gossypii TaxID=2800820 RepID=A0ABS7SA38_9MICO|nr:alpha/beta hydrolase [Occultella gossypii]MBZ2197060.1 alpha/beta hydrolase [Occultella gossypii]
MNTHFSERRTQVPGTAVTAAPASGPVASGAQADAGHNPAQQPAEKPTVVLVHGAWADASGWGGVITTLEQDGYPVLAVATPLRGLASDSAYVRSIVDSIDGDVVLVGHSYGGGVITNAAAGADNVSALVYVAAFAPDEGEIIGQFNDPVKYPGSELTPDSLILRPYPGGLDATIDPERFRQIFAADLPVRQTDIMAATQRPTNVAVLEEQTGEPAWKTIPSWYQVSNQDKALSPVAQRFFAQRMGAHTTSINASHAGYVSDPTQTANLIQTAARVSS